MAGPVAAAPPAGAPAAGGAGAAAPPQAQGISWAGVFRMILMYYAITWWFKPSAVQRDSSGNPTAHLNAWQDGTIFSIDVYVTTKQHMDWKQAVHDNQVNHMLVWHQDQVAYSWAGAEMTHSYNYTLIATDPYMQHLYNNGTLYAHIFLTRQGYQHLPSKQQDHSGIDPRGVIYHIHPLNTYKPRPKIKKTKNLLSPTIPESLPQIEQPGEPQHVEEEGVELDDDGLLPMGAKKINYDDEDEFERPASGTTGPGTTAGPLATSTTPRASSYQSFWKPTLPISLVHDFTVYPFNGVPVEIRHWFHEADSQVRSYQPLFIIDEFWHLSSDLIAINETVHNVTVLMSYSTTSMIRWRMKMQMEESWKVQNSYGASGDGETEMFKRMILDTNPYLLGVTMVVSMLHMIFDFLAFKNDISFWKEAKSMEGLSARSIVMNCVCQGIIFLYLLDNETSWMILVSSGIGVAIEVWKIRKVLIVSIDQSGRIPKLVFRSKFEPVGDAEPTPEQAKALQTQQYDREAMYYLSWALYPLVAGYAVYSLYYEDHKSWYSWILGSLTGCVYTFGFIMMCPQLYLNYKLKSVAHLPWRMLTYKALNTFIDDLFAFIITMPTLHRLSCFRDDIIFFIFLYQKWIYRVDYTRVNEFGLVPTTEEQKEGEQIATEQAMTSAGEPARIEEITDDDTNGSTSTTSTTSSDKDVRKRKARKADD